MMRTTRGHLVVDTNGKWGLYTYTSLPKNYTVIGTVTRDGFDTGALVRIEATGNYVQVNAGGMRTLCRRDVEEALRKALKQAGK